MSNFQPQANPPRPDWGKYEGIIRKFYLGDDHSLSDTMKMMREVHGLSATKAQYESQFKKWGISKNFRSRDLDIVCRHILNRMIQNKQSVVYYKGRPIPFSRVKKQLAQLPRKSSFGCEPSLPPGFSIRTPPGPDKQASIRTLNLPFYHFSTNIRIPSNFNRAAYPPLPIPERGPIGQNLNHRQIPNLTTELDDQTILNSAPSGIDGRSWAQGDQFYHASSVLDGPAFSNLATTDESTLSSVSLRHEQFIKPHLQALFPASWMLETTGQQQSDRVASSTALFHSDCMSSAYAHLLIFGISNNFAGLDGLSHADIWSFLRHRSSQQLVRFIQTFQGITARSLAEKLFICALEASDAEGIDILLRDGKFDIDIDEFCMTGGKASEWINSDADYSHFDEKEKCTPIGYACFFGDFKTAKVLLRHGANYSKISTIKRATLRVECHNSISEVRSPYFFGLESLGTLEKESITALEYVFTGHLRKYNGDSTTLPQFVRFLLEAGITITRRTIALVVNCLSSSCNPEIFRILFDAGTPEQHSNWLRQGFFHKAVTMLDHESFGAMMQTLLAGCGCSQIPISIELKKPLDRWEGSCPKYPISLLEYILLHGNKTAFEGIIESCQIAVPDGCLAVALERDEVELARNLLFRGIDLEMAGMFRPTALSVAIRTEACEFLGDLGKIGVMAPVRESMQLYHALAAAIEIGDKHLFDRIMNFEVLADPYFLGACLIRAISRKDGKMCTRLVQAGADVNLASERTESLDHSVSKNLYLKRRVLDSAKYSMDHLHPHPLVLALKTKNHEILNAVLGHSTKIMEAHPSLYQPCVLSGLWRAVAAWGDHSVTYDLLSLGANVNDIGEDLSPLCAAVETSDEELFKLFLRFGANINAPGCAELCFDMAFERGDEDMVNLLLRSGADIKAASLIRPIQQNNTRIIDILLRAGADVNIRKRDERKPLTRFHIQTPLSVSLGQGNAQLIASLLAAGADPDFYLDDAIEQPQEIRDILFRSYTKKYPYGKGKFGSDILLRAIGSCDVQMVRYLTQLGIRIDMWSDIRSPHPLAVAVESTGDRRMELVRLLLEGGCDANAVVTDPCSCDGLRLMAETALGVAIRTKSIDLIQLMVDYHADIHLPCVFGGNRTPLQRAAEVGALDIVKYFLNLGADINAPAAISGGATALQAAAIQGYAGIVDFLIAQGADVNADGAKVKGRTALEGAAEHGRLDTVQLLLNAGARIDGAGQKQFDRAVELATENVHFSVVDILKKSKQLL